MNKIIKITITGDIEGIKRDPREIEPTAENRVKVWKQFVPGDEIIITGKNMKMSVEDLEGPPPLPPPPENEFLKEGDSERRIK